MKIISVPFSPVLMKLLGDSGHHARTATGVRQQLHKAAAQLQEIPRLTKESENFPLPV